MACVRWICLLIEFEITSDNLTNFPDKCLSSPPKLPRTSFHHSILDVAGSDSIDDYSVQEEIFEDEVFDLSESLLSAGDVQNIQERTSSSAHVTFGRKSRKNCDCDRVFGWVNGSLHCLAEHWKVRKEIMSKYIKIKGCTYKRRFRKRKMRYILASLETI